MCFGGRERRGQKELNTNLFDILLVSRQSGVACGSFSFTCPIFELARIPHEVHEQSGLLDDLHRSTFASFCEEISENSASALKFSSLEDMSGRCLSDQVEIELHRRRQLGIIKEDSAIVHWKCVVHDLRLDR